MSEVPLKADGALPTGYVPEKRVLVLYHPPSGKDRIQARHLSHSSSGRGEFASASQEIGIRKSTSRSNPEGRSSGAESGIRG